MKKSQFGFGYTLANNGEIMQAVSKLLPFSLYGNRLIAIETTNKLGRWYVVKSYGHYPILAYNYNTKKWHQIDHFVSNTTAKHLSNAVAGAKQWIAKSRNKKALVYLLNTEFRGVL